MAVAANGSTVYLALHLSIGMLLCCRLTNLSYAAVVADYSTWIPPYSYSIMAQLEEKVGYIENGKCLRNATFQELLVCPVGQESASVQQLLDNCAELGISCPPVSCSTFFARRQLWYSCTSAC